MAKPDSDKPTIASPDEIAEIGDEPPVVARLVVEIRSDGSRTIARGAMEDRHSGQSVAVEARGDSPMQLALSLAKMIAQTPSLARTAAKALLPAPKRQRRRDRARRFLRRLRKSR